MKILKRILIALVVLVAIFAVVGMFMSPSVHVARSKDMKASQEAVYNQIADLKMWDNWMPWNKMDPNWKRTWGEKTSGEGASYSWNSDKNDVGHGTITITKAVPYEQVENNLHFEGEGDAGGAFKIEKTDAGSKVTWSLDMNMGSNPFKRLMGGMMNKMMAPIFDKGLTSLDSAALANPMTPPAAMMDSSMHASADTTAAMTK
jgi:hypothetical protein